MINTRTITAVALLVLFGNAWAAPRYASEDTREVIEAMVEAHGGMDRWLAAPSIRFDNIMYNPYHEKNQFAWWVSHEVIDQETRKVWQAWPMHDATIGFDGDAVWSDNWRMANPPTFMVHFFYYFVNLPWLTQDDGVRLSEVTEFEWPGVGTLNRVEMRFVDAPGVGKTDKDYFVLFIDPNSSRLVAYQYAIAYQPMLDIMNVPADREVFGPMWRMITSFEEVDGLLFPTAWRTMPGPNERIVGNHVILNIDISTPFEDEKAAKPEASDVLVDSILSGPR